MKIKFLSTALIISLLFSCKIDKQRESVLLIGNYKLTSDEVLLKRKNQKYKALDNQAFEEKLIEDGRILAFALDHKYDTISNLNKLLEYASRSYASRIDGFVWNKEVNPQLRLTEKDINDAYLKRSHELKLQIIQFADKSTLNKCYSSAKDFNSLSRKSSNQNIKILIASTRFPYYPLSLYTDSVDKAKAGDVLGPFETESGYIISRVEAIQPVEQKFYEQEKAMIRKELLSGLTQKYAWKKQKEILAAATPEINVSVIKELTLKFDAAKKSFSGVDPKIVLMTFTFEGKRIPFSVSDFREFVTNTPVFYGALNNPEDVKKILGTIITEQYLFAEAKRMNITEDQEYLQFRRSYQERIFIEYYKRNYIYPELIVLASESRDYYRKYSSNFKAFESAEVLIYKFKDIQKAFQGRMLLAKRENGLLIPVNNSSVEHAMPLPEAQALEIKLADQHSDPKLIKAVLALAPGQISSPVEVNGSFLLIILSAKRGVITLPYSYAEEKINQLIYAQKERQMHVRLAVELERKYPTKKNTIKECLSRIKADKL